LFPFGALALLAATSWVILGWDCLQIVRKRLQAFTCVLNFDGFQGYRPGKVRLALRAVT
jgi:hypothetical protein